MEDILTSNVFGLFKYLPSHMALFPFLARAKGMDGAEPLVFLKTLKNAKVEYSFWPYWQETKGKGCEPDVVLSIESKDSDRLMILIEAKYLSGKSSEADESDAHPTDQLAREWSNLLEVARHKNARPFLVYLTADVGAPLDVMRDSVKEFESKESGEMSGLCWLSWRHLHEVSMFSQDLILRDLGSLISRMGFVFLAAPPTIAVIPEADWRFERPPVRFDWPSAIPEEPISWSFSR